jgi:predicted dehydrogenase
MSNLLRIGLIGAGVIGRKHAAYLKASTACALVAIADPSPDAEDLAAGHDAACYRDFDGMLDREQLDGVIIAVPNDLHEAAGTAAAARGVAMLVEKPIAADLEAAGRLTAAAARAGVPLLVGHHRRYNPRTQRAQALVQGGALGKLVAVNTVWGVKKPDSYFDTAWRKEPGGGPILINLIHEIDLLRFIVGEIAEVMAFGGRQVRGFEVEDSASVALRFAGGALGTVLISDATPSPWSWERATGENPVFPESEENPSRFLGTEAAMAFPRLTIWRHDGPTDWQSPLEAEVLALPKVDVYAEQIAHFLDVIRGEAAPIITGEDATRSLAATLAVAEAVRTKGAVTVA